MQGDIHFDPSNGLRTVDRTIIYQYRQTEMPENPLCSSNITESRNITVEMHDHALVLLTIPLIPLLSGSTIRRDIIGSVSHQNLSFGLLVDKQSLWSGI